MTEDPRKATHLLDVMRGLAIIIVLYGHALETLFLRKPEAAFVASAFAQYKPLAAFTMALFFFVSGASAARLARKRWTTVARTSLYLAALAWLAHGLGLGVMLAETLLGATPTNLSGWLHYALASTLKGNGFSIVVVWYLVTLALVRLFARALLARFSGPALWCVLGLLVIASLAVPLLPNPFGLKTWIAGTVFFVAGAVLAPRLATVPAWLWLPLLPVLAGLGIANRGCPWDPVSVCALPGLQGEAVVWLHIGEVGFIPLFWVAAGLGILVALSLCRALLRTPLAAPLGRIGRRTLDILLVNGFVLVFVQPRLPALHPDQIEVWHYPLILLGVVGLHLLAIRLLERPLAALNHAALAVADRIMTAASAVRRRLSRAEASADGAPVLPRRGL